MAKDTTGRSSGRRQKTSRTIDLEANKKPETVSAGSGTDKGSDAVTADSSSGQKADSSRDSTNQGAASKPASKNAGDKTAGDAAGGSTGGDKPARPGTSVPPTSVPPRSSSAPPASGQPAKAARSGTSFVSLLLAGLLGGGVALGGAGALNNAGMLSGIPLIGGLFGAGNSDTGASLQAANDRIGELGSRLEAIESANGASANAEIAALSERLSQLENRIPTDGGDGTETARQALNLARSALEKADATAAQIADLNDRIVDSAGGSSIDIEAVKSALSADTTALAARIDAVEKAVSEGNGAAADEAVSGLQAEIETVRTGIAQLQTLRDPLQTMQEEVGGLDAALRAVDERVAALEASLNEKVLPSINEVEKAASAAVESQRVARSVSARALGSVLEQGGRFASELAAAEALVGGSEAVAGLRDLSQAGILTNAELQQRFLEVSNGILSREAAKQEGDGILDRFMASAKSLVQVRPAGPVDGDSTVAVISRIEAALGQGDLAAAQAEWEQLGDEAKAASSTWAMALGDRIRAERLIEQVIGELSAQSGQEG